MRQKRFTWAAKDIEVTKRVAPPEKKKRSPLVRLFDRFRAKR